MHVWQRSSQAVSQTSIEVTTEVGCCNTLCREYKAQLAADRVQKLAGGTNQSELHVKAGKIGKKDHKTKDRKHHKSDKTSKKHKDSKKKLKSREKSKKSKHKHHSSSDSSSDSDSEQQKLPSKSSGPVKLSDFMRE